MTQKRHGTPSTAADLTIISALHPGLRDSWSRNVSLLDRNGTWLALDASALNTSPSVDKLLLMCFVCVETQTTPERGGGA